MGGYRLEKQKKREYDHYGKREIKLGQNMTSDRKRKHRYYHIYMSELHIYCTVSRKKSTKKNF
jgi:hypothetical protein